MAQGGIFLTCSCTGLVGEDAFLDTLEPGVSEPSSTPPPAPRSLAAYVRAEGADESTDTLPAGTVPVLRLVIAGFVATLGSVLVMKLGAAIASRPPAPPPAGNVPMMPLAPQQ